MHEHGGDDAPPLAVYQDGPRVVGAPVAQLIGGGAPDADPAPRHGKKNQAIDAYQRIGSRRVSPGGTPPVNRGRRRRSVTSLRTQNLRMEGGISGWRSGGKASHLLTLMHFGAGLYAEE